MRYTIKPHATNTSAPIEGVEPGIFCRWDCPEEGRSVTLDSPMVFELAQAAIEASLAIPRSVEMGGLLLGRIRQEESGRGEPATTVFEITGYQEVPCAHRFGPFYVLDRLDRERLLKLMARHNRRRNHTVIGFYRSYSGTEAHLDSADRELMRTFFTNREMVCLLLNPRSPERCLADFRFWNDGETAPERPYAAFPFDAALMRREDSHVDTSHPEREEIEAVEPENRVEAAPLFSSFGSTPLRRRIRDDEEVHSSRRVPGLVPVLCCIPLAIGATAMYDRWQHKPAPAPAAIHFDARQVGGGLLLQWDPADPAVAQATRGVLTVDDGGKPTELALSSEQLRAGSLPYASSDDDVLFRLHLFRDDKPVGGDSLRVVAVSALAAHAETAPRTTASAAPVVPAALEVPKPAPGPDASSADRAIETDERPATPPVARREVQPYISEGIRSRIQSPLVVPVNVSVSSSGRVTHATANVTGHGLPRYLADEAVKAARQWTFTPARAKDGSPVAAEKTLHFEFAPGTR